MPSFLRGREAVAGKESPIEAPLFAGRGPAPEAGLPILRVMGQVASTYIIAEGPDGLYLVDQHADRVKSMLAALEKWLASVVRSLNGKDYK